ncbi:MAG TPA: DUF523 domain-containing protein [Spongiibacteraceae bacterium]|jgi:uncharacterized protein YbbK (DUF523 family)
MSDFPAMEPCIFDPLRFYDPRSAAVRAAVAVSACLTGEKVRYDGADKLLPAYSILKTELALIPICPEVGAGLTIPRPPVQLMQTETGVRAVGRDKPALDITGALQQFAEISLQQLTGTRALCGYLWKSRSPSCGLDSTPLFNASGCEIDRISGIQSAYFQRELPWLNYCEDTVVESATSAMRFVLQCRLVFDLLYTSATSSLKMLHQHYSFLHSHFNWHTQDQLETLSNAEIKTDYLAALLNACNQMPEDELLSLFKWRT